VDELKKEGVVLCRYLIGEPPTEYVIKKYCEGVRVKKLNPAGSNKPERLFLWLSTRLPILIRMIDTYTTLFYPNSTFRMRLVLMLAILECSAPTHARIDTTDTESKLLMSIKSGYQAVFFALSAVFGFILFTPLRLLYLKHASE